MVPACLKNTFRQVSIEHQGLEGSHEVVHANILHHHICNIHRRERRIECILKFSAHTTLQETLLPS